MKTAPIALFTYNRLHHTRRTIEALCRNKRANESVLYIFSDGPRNEIDEKAVHEVRTYTKGIDGFAHIEIIEHAENRGLSQSIITGVTDIINKHGVAIVLEDDLVTSPYFLTYMNEALDMYESEERVVSVHGYIYPVNKPLPQTFFLRGADCWGWATWKRAWQHFEPDGKKLLAAIEAKNLTREFDFDGSYPYTAMLKRQIAGVNDSWAIRWYASAFTKDLLTLYPGRSLVDNIGQDKTGVHGTQGHIYKTDLSDKKIAVEKIRIEENTSARRVIVDFFRSIKPSLWRRVARKIKSWV